MGTQLYSDDLAYVHIEGYGFHWEGMAPGVLAWLCDAGTKRGKVVDLGCGGGDWLARLTAAGYTPCGVDVSPAMIRAARRRVPGAELLCGSFAEVELPKCAAVTSFGEPLNYLRTRAEFRRVLKIVFRALEPGGLFIFDVRLPASKPVAPRVVARTGKDWACIARIDENGAKQQLVRQITTFRLVGQAYRRSEKRHILKLHEKREIAAWLKAIGFRVRTFRRCGEYQLGKRQAVFVAQKGRKPQAR